MSVIALSLDGVGALVIAWPILRPGSAAREAARPRWGGDHWASFRRERELRLVQSLALAAGFALQALGFVIRLDEWWWLAVACIAAVVSAGVLIGTALARRGLPKHVWYPGLPPRDQVGTGLHTYGVSIIADLELVVRHSLLTRGVTVERVKERSSAVVSSGWWRVFCPRCHEPTTATTPDWGQAICTVCGAQYVVEYPDPEERERIELELVLQRTQKGEAGRANARPLTAARWGHVEPGKDAGYTRRMPAPVASSASYLRIEERELEAGGEN